MKKDYIKKSYVNSLVLIVVGLALAAIMKVGAIENYREVKNIFWEKLYPSGHTLYCRANILTTPTKKINIEHVFPMAWVKNSLQCGTRDECRANSNLFNEIEADLHNLYPVLAKLNYDRQAYRFGIIKGEDRRYGDKCDFEVDEHYRVAEPRPGIRGEVARAMFYMESRYKKLSLFKKQADILLKWHFKDLPSEEEKWRNDKIEQIQGNRNPFIDNPELIKQRVQKQYKQKQYKK